jgi:phage shock protein A
MPHDKIKAAARERMAQTGEPYAAARRAVVTEHQSAAGESPGYVLRMSGEIHDWLAGLRDGNPAIARYVVQALATLMREGAGLGYPRAVSPAGSWPEALVEALDRSYQEELERQQILRRGHADAVSLIRDLENQLAGLEPERAGLEELHRRALDAGEHEQAASAADRLASLLRQEAEVRRMLPEMTKARQRLEEQSRRGELRLDTARMRKEVLRARYVAAQSGLRVHQTIAGMGLAEDDQEDSGDAVSAAHATIRDVVAQMERELGQQPWPEDLMELRPGASHDTEIRIFFGVEPPGTALLIAVVEGAEAVADQYLEAVLLSAEMLHRVRAGQAPEEAVAHSYQDPQSLLAEFHPGEADPAST